MGSKSAAVQRAEDPTALKPVTFESLIDRVNDVFNAITRRAYEIFETNGHAFGHDLENWFQAEKEILHPVHVQITESGDSLEVKAEVPGFNEKELEISVEPRRLTITGEREASKEEKKGKTVYSEIYSDQILRIVELPAEVDATKVTATLKNGTLELTMPKATEGSGSGVQPKEA